MITNFLEFLENERDFETSVEESESEGFDTKCGEILLSIDGEFTISCDSCHQQYNKLQLFSKHIFNNHLNHDTDNKGSTNILEITTEENGIIEYLDDFQNSLTIENLIMKDERGETLLEEKKISKTTEAINFYDDCVSVTNSQISPTIDNIIENDTEIYNCSFCGRIYRKKTVWMEHEYRHLTTNIPCETIYTCPESDCKKTFNKKCNFNSHLISHSNDRNFKCNYCPKMFKTQRSLDIHHKRHKGIKPFSCNYCDKNFLVRAELETHHRVHRNERPYQCEICGQSYRTNQKLKEHIKRHTNQRDWKCNECGKNFFDGIALKNHQIIHKPNPKRFGCNICNASFTRKTVLSNHKKLHSKQKEYFCKICLKRFSQKAGLYFHIKTCNATIISNEK